MTGIGGLSTRSTLLRELVKWPYDEDLALHSIIGNRREAGKAGGTDGVVTYDSSHIDGVESETIVRSGHSVQNKPATLVELRRILHLHLALHDADN